MRLSEVAAATAEGGSCADAAIGYGEFGFPVYPAQDKRPWPGYGGAKRATTDPVTIASVWSDWPSAGVGWALADTGYVVVDIDVPDGERSAQSLDLPDTLTAGTPRGGYHLVYRLPPGAQPKFKIGILEGIDIPHWVVVPPSPGRTWLNVREPALAPRWVLEGKASRGRTGLDGRS